MNEFMSGKSMIKKKGQKDGRTEEQQDGKFDRNAKFL